MVQLELVHPAPPEAAAAPRADHAVIAQIVREGAKALDVGCGDGALAALLAQECGARVRGLEINPALAHAGVKRGLSIVQGDAERDLGEFPSGSFDTVIFSRTLQQLRDPEEALRQAARIGDQIIVSIFNGGRWDARARFAFKGRLGPAQHGVLHRYSVRDFADLARSLRLSIERAVPLSRGAAGAPFAKTLWRANWFCEEAVFVLTP